MDTERALATVGDLLVTVESHYANWAGGLNSSNLELGHLAQAEIIEKLVPVELIAQAVAPDLLNQFAQRTRGWKWGAVRDAAVRLRTLLQQREEIDEIIGPTGPRLVAERLHTWVWEAAASLWSDGYRRSAIQAAGAQIELHLRSKLGRHDGSITSIALAAFSLDDPKAGEPRLRLPGFTLGTQTFKAAHEGAKFFGAGCFLAVRDVATHTLTEPSEQEGLEQLAALSVLARWIDKSRLVEATIGR
jgi:uncharacterized protein Ymh